MVQWVEDLALTPAAAWAKKKKKKKRSGQRKVHCKMIWINQGSELP